MEIKRIWLIDHKASLGEFSPMNLDGSSWILGICVLSAKNQEEASIKFNAFLKNEDMELLELYEVCEYNSGNFKDNSRKSKQVNHAANKVVDNEEICYVFARTSEAMADGVDSDE